MRLTNPLLIIITTFIISCQSQDDGIKPNQSDASSTSQAGTIHNLYLSEIIDHFNQKTNKPTRSGDIAEDFIKQMASIQTVILKNQNFKNMTPAQINTFVRNSVDISIDPAIINGIESSLTTKGYSIIPEMNPDAPLTPAVKGFIEEIERIEAGNYSDVIIESKMAKAYTTWIREADNDEDKKLIADYYDVYLGSTKYWQNNSNAWEIGLKSSFKIGSFLKRIVFGDVKATAWACWKAKKYAIVFWKAMLAAGAAGSAYSAIRYLIAPNDIWELHSTSTGERYYRIDDQTYSIDEIKTLIYKEVCKQNPGLNFQITDFR